MCVYLGSVHSFIPWTKQPHTGTIWRTYSPDTTVHTRLGGITRHLLRQNRADVRASSQRVGEPWAWRWCPTTRLGDAWKVDRPSRCMWEQVGPLTRWTVVNNHEYSFMFTSYSFTVSGESGGVFMNEGLRGPFVKCSLHIHSRGKFGEGLTLVYRTRKQNVENILHLG